MARRYYNLPPLTMLAAFEAAARYQSFKHAAQELSVTPGAVSHQVKALETELGVALFTRKHRGVELTPDGEALFETLSASFGDMSRTLKSIQDKHDRKSVTVGSTSAVAALWLSPTLLRFWQAYPEVDVNQIIQDTQSLNIPQIDLFVSYGQVHAQHLTQDPLFRDHLVPVGSRALSDRLAAADLPALAQQRLIHLETENRNWTTWHNWFRELGYDGPIAPGIRVNNYAVALQAAQDGAGLALGWRRLIGPMLADERLHPVGAFGIDAPHRFHLVGRDETTLSDAARTLKHWILKETNDQSDEFNSPIV